MRKLSHIFQKSFLFFACLLFAFVLFPASNSMATDSSNVLFICSYSESFLSVPEQIRGVKSVLDPLNISVDIEYMDMKRFENAENLSLFYNTLSYKLANTAPYDAILVGDDAALQFALDHYDELFCNLPLVFLCINDETRAQTALQNPNITGIMEISDSLRETIEIAYELYPNAKNVAAIVDDTLTGQGDQKQFLSQASNFPSLEFNLLNVSDYTFAEFGDVLLDVDDDTLLLYMCMFNDKANDFMDINEASAFIAKHTKVPVFRHSIGGVGNGLLGGKMLSFYDSGVLAAEMVADILHGTPVSMIDAVRMAPDNYYFDYQVMQTFGITKEQLPADTTLINEEYNLFQEYKREITFAIIIFIVLILITILLLWDNVKRRSILNQIKQMNRQIEHQASHDYLTQLPNRFSFMKRLEDELGCEKCGTVFLIDIDNFKSINDIKGHIYGDKVLVSLANKLRSLSDDNFFISRHGGDEFLLLLSGVQEQATILEYAQKIIALFSEVTIIDGQELFLSCSIGIASFPQDSDNVEQLIMYADTAMYKVKFEGKNNYMFYSQDLNKEFADRIELGNLLRQAVKNDGFTLFYQPLVDVKTQQISSFEALLRLKNYSISPAIFISVAEELGLIMDIGRWVVATAIAQLASWREMGLPPKTVSINFSNLQLKDDGFLVFLQDTLRKYDVSPSLLEIEITESILLRKTDDVLRFLHEIKTLGVRLSLDDFGTGYSSLNYLTYIPVDKVKLDKSLVDKFLTDEHFTFMKSLISMLHELNVSITAEGIEYAWQFFQLKKTACDTIQGYLFSKPLPVSEINEIYEKAWNIE